MKEALAELVALRALNTETAEPIFESLMAGEADPVQVAAALALIQARGATSEELVAGARAMRRHLVPVAVPDGLTVLDTCGTGGTLGPP